MTGTALVKREEKLVIARPRVMYLNVFQDAD